MHKCLAESIHGYKLVAYSPKLEYCPLLMSKLSRERTSLMHTSADYGIFFSHDDVPMIMTFHGYFLDSEARKHSTIIQRIHYKTDLRWYTKLSIARANRLTAVSNYVADIARSDLGCERNIRVIYNGVDTNRFIPFSNNQHRNVRVFYSGNITARKGAYLLPEISKRLNKDIRIIYTQGMRSKNILPPINNLEPVSAIAHDSMPSRYVEMDILIIPSFREGISMAVIEAMACGLPIVASNSSSFPEMVVHGKGGYLCNPGDAADFAEKINVLASSSVLRKQMGEFNRERAERIFNSTSMVRSYELLFEEILDQGKD